MAAGLVAPATAQAALPAIDYTVSGTTGDNGWYRSAVTVSWSVTWNGTPVSSSGCDPAVRLVADTPGLVLSCRAENSEGTIVAHTRAIKIDQRPPLVTAVRAARTPDSNGWYRSPVAVTWSGTDATSGIASCTTILHSGPDGAASLPGTCRDVAGNVSAEAPYPLRYDDTAPDLSAVSAAGGDTVATVRWRASADATVTVTRDLSRSRSPARTVYQGRAGRFEDVGLRNRARYSYTVTATDAAGNAKALRAVARTGSRLRGPRPGARVTAPPVLRWNDVSGAAYYNVQLYRGRRKVLSAWPSGPALELQSRWSYGGRRWRLTPGTYRGYVWPGYGERTERRYGRLLGSRRFAVLDPRAA